MTWLTTHAILEADLARILHFAWLAAEDKPGIFHFHEVSIPLQGNDGSFLNTREAL
jgi:hypothetical protein